MDHNGKIITVGEQNFETSTIMIKEENGNIISCPMFIDEHGDIYFVYDNTEVFLKYIGGDDKMETDQKGAKDKRRSSERGKHNFRNHLRRSRTAAGKMGRWEDSL